MASIMFGEGIDPVQGLVELLSNTGKLTSTDAQILRRMRYEQDFGIVDHNALSGTDEEVFALVTLNDNENIWRGDMMHERAKRFYKLRMSTITGMSWKEFIELPKSVCDMWFDIAEEHNRTESAVADDLATQFGTSGLKP